MVCVQYYGGEGRGKCISCSSLPPTNPRGRKKIPYAPPKKKKKQCLSFLSPRACSRPIPMNQRETHKIQFPPKNIKIYCCRKVLSLKSLAHYTVSEIVSNCKSSLSAATCESGGGGEEREREGFWCMSLHSCCCCCCCCCCNNSPPFVLSVQLLCSCFRGNFHMVCCLERGKGGL